MLGAPSDEHVPRLAEIGARDRCKEAHIHGRWRMSRYGPYYRSSVRLVSNSASATALGVGG